MSFVVDSLRLNDVVSRAGELLVSLSQDPQYRQPFAKPDGSPVTLTDRLLSDFLYAELSPLFPVICEERPPQVLPANTETYFLIDPLDGTKYYVAGEDEYAICVGLIHHGRPVYGAIFDPHGEELLWASLGQGAYYGMRRLPALRNRLGQGLKAFSSGFHNRPEGADLMNSLGVTSILEKGSALKFCDLAMGQVDLYLRFGQTSEWDTAAAQIILEEVGGGLYEVATLAPLQYGKAGWLNRGLFAGEAETLRQLAPVLAHAKAERKPSQGES